MSHLDFMGLYIKKVIYDHLLSTGVKTFACLENSGPEQKMFCCKTDFKHKSRVLVGVAFEKWFQFVLEF